MMNTNNENEVIQNFIEETVNHINKIRAYLSAITRDHHDRGSVTEMYRSAHNIKDRASRLKFEDIREAALGIENLAHSIQEEIISIDEQVIDMLGKHLNRLELSLRRLASERYPLEKIDRILSREITLEELPKDVEGRSPETDTLKDNIYKITHGISFLENRYINKVADKSVLRDLLEITSFLEESISRLGPSAEQLLKLMKELFLKLNRGIVLNEDIIFCLSSSSNGLEKLAEGFIDDAEASQALNVLEDKLATIQDYEDREGLKGEEEIDLTSEKMNRFLEEVGEKLDLVNNTLLKLERQKILPDPQSLAELSSALNSIKVSTANMGFTSASTLADGMQRIVNNIIEGKLQLVEEIQLLFDTIDGIGMLLQSILFEEEEPRELLTSLQERLETETEEKLLILPLEEEIEQKVPPLQSYIDSLRDDFLSLEIAWEREEDIEELTSSLLQEVGGLRRETIAQEYIDMEKISSLIQEALEKLRVGELDFEEDTILWLLDAWDALQLASTEEEVAELLDRLESTLEEMVEITLVTKIGDFLGEDIWEEVAEAEKNLLDIDQYISSLNQEILSLEIAWEQSAEAKDLLESLCENLSQLSLKSREEENLNLGKLSQLMKQALDKVKLEELILSENVILWLFDAWDGLKVLSEEGIGPDGDRIYSTLIDRLKELIEITLPGYHPAEEELAAQEPTIKVRNILLEKVGGQLEAINRLLSVLEENLPEADPALLEDTSQVFHSLKGSLSSAEYSSLFDFLGELIRLVDSLKDGVLKLGEEELALLFESVDGLGILLQNKLVDKEEPEELKLSLQKKIEDKLAEVEIEIEKVIEELMLEEAELPEEEIAVEERAIEIDLSRHLLILSEGIVSIEMGWERGEEIEEEIVEEMRKEIEGLREEAEKQERVKLKRIAEILQEGIEKLKMGDITLSEEALLWLFEIWDALKTLSEGEEIEEEEIISLRDGLEKLEVIPIPEEIIPEVEVIPEELPIEEIAVEEGAIEIDLSRYLFILNEGIVSIEMGWERGEEIEEEIVEEMREEIEGLREEAEKQERVKLRRIAEILQEGIEKLKMGDITLSEEALLWLFEIWDALKILSEGEEIEEEEIISLRDGLEKLEAIPIPEEIIPEVEVIPEEEISIEEKLFIKEAEEHLDLLNQIFLTMWNQLPEYDRELLIEMEHRLDALQESAHLLEYESIDRLTQRMLDVSERIRDNRIELTEDILRVFFDCFNELEISTESLILGEEISTEMIDNLEAKLQSILEEKVVMEEIPEEELVEEITPVAEEEKIPIVPPEVAIPTVRTAEVDMGRLDRLTNLVAELTISKTRLSGELSELVKGIGELMNERRKIKRFEKEFTATIEKGAEELPKPQISREFNILAQDLKTMTTDINKISSNLDKIRSELYTNTDYLSRVADELQQEIIRERILPISNLFSRFPQVVQDIAIEKGKKVELLIKGGDTRIDKAILEDIGDSLLYLIRNEINHSIETPEEREKNGKSEIGQLTLNAYHWGNSIIIEMEDDGAGIDDQLLIKQAIGRGFITQTEADQMSKKEGLELIFLPDFSSAETSEGEIGLDAVRNNVARLRGSLDIQSTVGKGAKFTIKLPLNLATTQVLMIKVSLQTFAINSDSISGIMRISERYIGRAEEGEIFKWGGQTIPLLYLKDVLNIDSSQSRKITESEKRGQRQAGLLTVIVSSAGRRIGLIVDELLSKQEIVIKGLGKYLGRVKDIAGATISSDGTVILVLDIPSLVEGVKIKG